MKHRLISTAALACMTLAGTAVHAQSTALVNFDPPGTTQGPSIFVAVPAIQNITTEPATFGGGVVLGLATFFPAIQFATGPNVYGTADFGNNLGKALTIDINPTFGNVNQVSFALFNGETYTESYLVSAFSGSNLVASQTLNNILPNFNSGYAIADVSVNPLVNTPITRVTIAPTTTAHTTWDFLIDTVTFNQSITSVVPVPVYVPQVPSVPAPPPVVYTPQPPELPSVENQNPEIIKLTQEQSDSRQKRKRKGKDGKDEEIEVVTVINFGDDSVNSKSKSLELDLTNKTVQIYAAPIIQSPVPEPTTWALMLAGVAGLGLMARRRGGHATDRLRG